MKYKYHYVVKKSGVDYDSAQDTYMLHAIMDWICQYFGASRMSNFKVEKKRISVEDWKARYC